MASERPTARSAPLAPPPLQGVLREGGSLHGSFHGVFFQVRRGLLTEEDLGRIHAAGLRHRARFPRDQKQGMLLLTEPGSLIPAESVRLKQRSIVNDLLKDPRVRMAVVIVGEDIDATMLRSVSRGVVRSHPQLHIFSNPDEACDWIASEVGLAASDVRHGLQEARDLAAREIG
jgi:hypothetical protein